MPKFCAYPHGNAHLGINPVHSFFGLKLRMNLFEAHHGYFGIILMIIGAYLSINEHPATQIIGCFIFILGAYLAHDDFVDQHPKQVHEYDPLYHSPVHVYIYDTLHLYDNKYFRFLNNLVDKLFGKAPHDG